ncbi:MAG: lysophospholipase L1-like esterase [Myxococcota bacterium]|jgi:lysophospholipase L1-like esterase
MSAIPWSRRWLLAALIAALLVLSAEGVSRLLWSADAVAADPMLSEHPTLLWTLRPGLETNALGLRDDPIAIPAPATRILSMGESTTWGHGVAASETYSEQLEARLQAEGRDAEVVNAGVKAWSIWQSYVFLAEHGRTLAPDAVMLYHLRSDALPRGAHTDRERYERRRPYRHLLALLAQSRLYQALRPLEGVSGTQPRVPKADRQTALEGIAALCQSMGTELVVLVPVYRRHSGEDRVLADPVLTDFAASTGAKRIDLAAKKSDAELSDDGFFLDPFHPSPDGHAHIAGWIHAEITDAAWLR